MPVKRKAIAESDGSKRLKSEAPSAASTKVVRSKPTREELETNIAHGSVLATIRCALLLGVYDSDLSNIAPLMNLILEYYLEFAVMGSQYYGPRMHKILPPGRVAMKSVLDAEDPDEDRTDFVLDIKGEDVLGIAVWKSGHYDMFISFWCCIGTKWEVLRSIHVMDDTQATMQIKTTSFDENEDVSERAQGSLHAVFTSNIIGPEGGLQFAGCYFLIRSAHLEFSATE